MIPNERASGLSARDKTVEAQIAKIVSSEIFDHSPRMSRFLRFIMERAATCVKEYTIATEVFDRPATFDPRLDPLVRVEARRLRQKLAEYYATFGQNDAILIDLPKGSYVPDVRLRELTLPSVVPSEQIECGLPSVVVLPFLNLGGDTDRDYFVDGLSEELTTALAQVPELRVIARTSAFAFRGKSVDVREIGRKLNVRTLVEGSVRWSGPRLRITVQMADCHNGYHLFAKSFDIEEKELIALQNEIAQTICDSITPRLEDHVSLAPPKTVDPEAYRLYLRGRYHWNRRTLPDFEKAIAYCEQAIALQPDFAPAYSCIADSCWFLLLDMLCPPDDLLARAKAAASRAVELDPESAEAHSSFAISCLYYWQHEESAAHLRRAIELKPSYSTAHYLYACHHALRGRDEEALSEIRLALEFDPMSIMVNRAMVAALLQAGQFEGAVAQAKETIDLDPGFYGSYLYLAWTYMASGQHDLAVEPLEKARQFGGNAPAMLGYLAASRAQMGKTDEAKSTLRHLLDPAQPLYVPPLVIAVALVALGEMDKALDFLERAVDERCGTVMHARQDPFFLPLHGMPRFDEICRRMNLI